MVRTLPFHGKVIGSIPIFQQNACTYKAHTKQIPLSSLDAFIGHEYFTADIRYLRERAQPGRIGKRGRKPRKFKLDFQPGVQKPA